MISFPCPSCNEILTFKPRAAGKKGKCPHCQAIMDIPEAVPPVRSRLPVPPEEPAAVPADELIPAPPEEVAFMPVPSTEIEEGPPVAGTEIEGEPAAAAEAEAPLGAESDGEQEAESNVAESDAAPDASEYAPPTPSNPRLAALLSLVVPGLGQLYNGQRVKAAVFLIYQVAIVGLTKLGVAKTGFKEGFLSSTGLLCIGAASFLIVALLCVYDAHRTAKRRNRELFGDADFRF